MKHGGLATLNYDCYAPAPGRMLLSVDDARRLIRDETPPVAESESIPLERATGRVLARALIAQHSSPPFDASAMDGYAISKAMAAGARGANFTAVARIPAGQSTPEALCVGQAARIFTGAPVPAGTFAVVTQENACRVGDRVQIRQVPGPGANIRRAGEDIAEGETVLQAGQRVGAGEIAVAAAAGAGRMDVTRRIRVGLVVTGSELELAGAQREAAHVFDVNTPVLRSVLGGPEIEIVEVQNASDDVHKLCLQLDALAERVDCLITTGGISVGEEDHVRSAITSLGGRIVFNGVAVKPGKPVSFGRLRNARWLGLPGNPGAAFLMWHVFGRDLVARLAGADAAAGNTRMVVLSRALRHKPGRCEFRPARLNGRNAQGREVADCADATYSARMSSLAATDGYIVLDGDGRERAAGSLVEFRSYH